MHKSWLSWKSLSAHVQRTLKFHQKAQTHRELGKPTVSSHFKSQVSQETFLVWSSTRRSVLFLNYRCACILLELCPCVFRRRWRDCGPCLTAQLCPKHIHTHALSCLMSTWKPRARLWRCYLYLHSEVGPYRGCGNDSGLHLAPSQQLKSTTIAPHSMRPVFIPTGH